MSLGGRGLQVHDILPRAAGLPLELDGAGLRLWCFRFACKCQTCTSAAAALSSALPLDQDAVRHKREGKSSSLCCLWVISLLMQARRHILEHHGIFLGSQAFPEFLRDASIKHPYLRIWTKSKHHLCFWRKIMPLTYGFFLASQRRCIIFTGAQLKAEERLKES